MRDGSTRQIQTTDANEAFSRFLAKYQPSLVVLSGVAKGTEYPLDSERTTIGRGPGVDLAFEDTAMSATHAAVEFASDGFRIRDLDSTNGTQVNGSAASVAVLKHGDRLQLGEHQLQFVVEEREAVPTYELPDA